MVLLGSCTAVFGFCTVVVVGVVDLLPVPIFAFPLSLVVGFDFLISISCMWIHL